jgi:hypothetical protein
VYPNYLLFHPRDHGAVSLSTVPLKPKSTYKALDYYLTGCKGASDKAEPNVCPKASSDKARSGNNPSNPGFLKSTAAPVLAAGERLNGGRWPASGRRGLPRGGRSAPLPPAASRLGSARPSGRPAFRLRALIRRSLLATLRRALTRAPPRSPCPAPAPLPPATSTLLAFNPKKGVQFGVKGCNEKGRW